MNSNLFKYIKKISIYTLVFIFCFMIGNSDVKAKTTGDVTNAEKLKWRCGYQVVGDSTQSVYVGYTAIDDEKVGVVAYDISYDVAKAGEVTTTQQKFISWDYTSSSDGQMFCPSKLYFCVMSGSRPNYLAESCPSSNLWTSYMLSYRSDWSRKSYSYGTTFCKGRGKSDGSITTIKNAYTTFKNVSSEYNVYDENFSCEDLKKLQADSRFNGLVSSSTSITDIKNKDYCYFRIVKTRPYQQLGEATNGTEATFHTAMDNVVGKMKSYTQKVTEVAEGRCKEYLDEEVLDGLHDVHDKVEINYANLSIGTAVDITQTYNCDTLFDDELKNVIKLVLMWIRIAAPILLIILTAVDFSQVVISQDQDAIKKAVSKVLKRFIAALALFFIPLFVSIMLEWINDPTNPAINQNAEYCKGVLE